MVILFILFLMWVWKYFSNKTKKAGIVINEFYDLRGYLFERIDDPLMFGYKWRELLPICRFADERYKRFTGDLPFRSRELPFESSCEALLLQIMEAEDIEEHGASV